MPVYNVNSSTGGNNAQRATFRPPWVKGPNPLPMPAAPWTAKPTDKNTPSTPTNEPKVQKPILKKQSKIGQNAENGPTVIPVRIESSAKSSQQSGEKAVPIKVESTKRAPSVDHARNQPNKPVQTEQQKGLNSEPQQQPAWRRERPPTAPQQPPKPPTMDKKPPAPPMPPMPPPPPPGMATSQPPIERKPLSKEKAQKIEALRSRPRRRPDWSDMMKEVESGKKLRHVQCNDRSAPIIPNMKAKGQFVYESEKKQDDDRDKLLKQIQSGVRLKKVRTNDRSKPNLDGLRKFRRQMTIEEQIQKSVSMADVVAAATQPDELDDIDKVRDDLQSAKQMLALELRSKEALERENKRLAARLANLEAELEKEKSVRQSSDTTKGRPVRTDEDEKLIMRLKEEAAEADRIAKDMEHKYHTTAEELDNTRRKLESAWLRNQELENQLSAAAQGAPIQPLMKQPSRKIISVANGESMDLISDDEEETETESEEESEDGNATNERQTAKELKLLTSKLRTFREKQFASLKERRILKEELSKRQNELRQEKKKYKVLQKEVDKMAKLMRESDDDEEESTQDEEEESETESESEESEEEEESDEELPPNATPEDRKRNLMNKIKKHENRLSSLKKGNNLMKANIERLQDDIVKQREMSLALQEDLNNILADFG